MQLNIMEAGKMEENFFFEPIPNKTLETNEAKETLTKWLVICYVGDSLIPWKLAHIDSASPSTNSNSMHSLKIYFPIPTSDMWTAMYMHHKCR